jgi:hypothetical protein
MEELIYVKRDKSAQIKVSRNALMRLEIKYNRFCFNRLGAEVLGVKEKDGLMFAFNKKEKRAYIVKDNEEDAFFLHKKDEFVLKLQSKALALFFIETFDLLEKGGATFTFIIEKECAKKGYHEVKLNN